MVFIYAMKYYINMHIHKYLFMYLYIYKYILFHTYDERSIHALIDDFNVSEDARFFNAFHISNTGH